MYRKHFAPHRAIPSARRSRPTSCFRPPRSRELDVRLAHLLDLRGIGLVTGDSGSGKTCACRRVLTQLHTGLYRVLYVSLSTGNVMDLYKTISWEMGLSRRALPRRALSPDQDARSRASAPTPALAPSSSSTRPITSAPDVLEDLRLLTNYQMDAEQPPLPAPARPDRTAPPPHHGRP